MNNIMNTMNTKNTTNTNLQNWPDDICVLVPSYNSLRALQVFLDELFLHVPKTHVCVVDDASTDGTYEYCASINIMHIKHKINKGKGAALKTGFNYLTNSSPISNNVKWIITMDADGQHSPCDLYKFIREARKHPTCAMCIGARDMRLFIMPPARILSNRLTSFILTMFTRKVIKDSQCGYRIYSREFLKSVSIKYNRFEMETEVILLAAAQKKSIRFVRVQTLYLKGGASHIAHVRDTMRWVLAVLRVSRKNKNRAKK